VRAVYYTSQCFFFFFLGIFLGSPIAPNAVHEFLLTMPARCPTPSRLSLKHWTRKRTPPQAPCIADREQVVLGHEVERAGGGGLGGGGFGGGGEGARGGEREGEGGGRGGGGEEEEGGGLGGGAWAAERGGGLGVGEAVAWAAGGRRWPGGLRGRGPGRLGGRWRGWLRGGGASGG